MEGVAMTLRDGDSESKSEEDQSNQDHTDEITQDTTGQQEKSCHFLRLSAELRNEIYHLAIISHKKMGICTWTGPPRKNAAPSDRTNQPALTRTCRQIRQECLPIFYHCHTFKLHCGYKTQLPPIISEHIDKIQRFEIAHTYNFFDFDISQGLQNYRLTLTGHRPSIFSHVTPEIQLAMIERGKKYLDEQLQGGYGKEKLDVELLRGLAMVLDRY